MILYQKLKNSRLFKIYLGVVIAVSLVFIGANLIAQVEETPFVLKKYLSIPVDESSVPVCPDWVDVNYLSMKDRCTGLVWSRFELATFWDPESEPGYNWQQAEIGCRNFASNGMFRLPTVEELLTLIKYDCSSGDCQVNLDPAVLDIDGDTIPDINPPFFSNGAYWSINDFNEPAEWTDNYPQRDYKRSVNLNTGEVDNPVYNKDMRLNAWCIVDKYPEVANLNFSQVNVVPIENGSRVQGGDITVIYNRNCGQSANPDADCTELSETTCNTTLNKCQSIITGITVGTPTESGGYSEGPSYGSTPGSEGVPSDDGQGGTTTTFPGTTSIVLCEEGTHVEAGVCVPNTDPVLGTWKGNEINGDWACGDAEQDGIDDCSDNCIGIWNPEQGDADDDGIGDLCDDCFTWPPGSNNCLELTVMQGGTFLEKFSPYATKKTSSIFYCYDGSCCVSQGGPVPDSACTAFNASSNVVEYDMIYPDRSNVFGYLNADPDNDGIIEACSVNADCLGDCINVSGQGYCQEDLPLFSLGFIHDIPDALNSNFAPDGDFDGGISQMNFSGTGWDLAVLTALDDNSDEFRSSITPHGNWAWLECCTDGGMFDIAPVNTGWCVEITPVQWVGINNWFVKTPGLGGYSVGYDIPDMNSPIEICYTPL